MKLTLTITDATPSDIAHIASLLGGTSTVAVTAPAPVNDDDDGPEQAVAPGETDADGMPWDARIHSSKKSKVANGTWRKAKGVDAATITAVEAELRARSASPAPAPAPTTAPAPAAPPNAPVAAPPAAAPAPIQPPVAAAPAPAPAPVAAPPAAAAPAPAPATQLDFGGLMQIISNGMTSQDENKVINDEWINFFAQSVGVTALPEIAADAGKIKQVYDLIAQHRPALVA